MSRVLIAGYGYVGSVLAVELRRLGHAVTALRRSEKQSSEGVTMLRADLGEPSSLAGLPEVDSVFFLASPDDRTPEAYRRCYVDGTRNLISALQGTPRFFVVTSTAVYGQNDGEWVDENSPTQPADFRGATMLEAEAGVLAAVPASVIRFGGIYGPGRTRLIRMVESGQARCSDPPRYTNRIHRDDCAGMLTFLESLDSPASVYVGVDDEPATDCEVHAWLAEQLGVAPPARARNESGANKRVRNARIRSAGYDFRFPTFREGYGSLLK